MIYQREATTKTSESTGYSPYTKLKIAGLSIVAVLLLIIFFLTNFTVSQNERTVVTSFGQFSYIADPGLHIKWPFVNNAYSYRIDLQSLVSPNKINTYTVDNQEVDIVFTLVYRIPADKVEYIFANNRDYEARLMSMTVDRIKAAMGKVNVQQVAEKRGELRDSIKATLAQDALPLGIEVTDLQLTDLQFTDAFRAAVNNAAVQKANIESIEYQRQQAEKTALMVKIQAEGAANAAREAARGAADARLLQATAEAKAIQLQGEAQASAIKAQAEALAGDSKLVDLRRAERWDGKLPINIYGSAPIPFMNLTTEKP